MAELPAYSHQGYGKHAILTTCVNNLVKASYKVWELDGIGSVSDSTISGARVEFGWGF